MNIDNQLIEFYNKKIRQVFVYITSRCQLNCRQCLYKPLLFNESTDIDFRKLKELLAIFYSMGAYKVSFLGGEPTIYHDHVNKKTFTDVLSLCKEIGYKYVRFDTNGQFSEEFLNEKTLLNADEITFSLDGFDEKTNDCVRGKGSFKRCLANIQNAVKKGYKVQLTTCVHNGICPDLASGVKNMDRMISYAAGLGVSSINFHPILKVGIARDEWIDNTNIHPEVWMAIYQQINEYIAENKYPISVRLPMRFVLEDEYLNNNDNYNYCPLRMGERALIMPDGTIKVCAFTIGTPYHLAEYSGEKIELYTGPYSEYQLLEESRLNKHSKYECLFQHIDTPDVKPLCMSYKPKQNEIVWNDIRMEN